MMKMKKIAAMFFTAALLMSVFIPAFQTVSAVTSTTFTVSNVSGKKGAEVAVSVDISANSGVSAGTFVLNFDKLKLEAVSAVAGTGLTGGYSDINIDNTNGKVTMTYINLDGSNGSGSIMNIVFKIKMTAVSGSTALDLSVTEFLNNSYQAIPNTITDGTVTITYSPGDINGDGIVDLKDVTSLSRYIAGWQNITVVTEALDTNGDGTVDLKDVTLLSRYVAGWSVVIH